MMAIAHCSVFTCVQLEKVRDRIEREGGGNQIGVCVCVRACGFTRCTRLSLCGPPQNGGDMAAREFNITVTLSLLYRTVL